MYVMRQRQPIQYTRRINNVVMGGRIAGGATDRTTLCPLRKQNRTFQTHAADATSAYIVFCVLYTPNRSTYP